MMSRSDQSFQQQYSPQSQQHQLGDDPNYSANSPPPPRQPSPRGYPREHAPPVTTIREQSRKRMQGEPGLDYNELAGCAYCCFFPAAFFCTALMIFLLVFLVAEFVFAIMGLAQSRDVRNNPFQEDCARSMTNFLIVFGSFVIFLWFLSLCCTPRLSQIFQGSPSQIDMPNSSQTSNIPTGIFGTGFLFLLRAFLFIWVLYGFSTQINNESQLGACNLRFFWFFQLVTNFMFWGYMAMLLTSVLISLMTYCIYRSMDYHQQMAVKKQFGFARSEGAAAEAMARREKQEARRESVNNPAAQLSQV